MKMKFTVLFLIQMLVVANIYSQQLPVLDQNLLNRYTLHPGYTGEYRGLHTWDGYRNNLVGLSQNPTTLALNLNYRDSEKHGFGASLLSDKTGLFSNTFFQLSYGYRFKLANAASLTFGMSAGVAQNRFDFNSVIVEDKSDVGTVANTGKTMFQVGVGAAYTTDRFTVGVGFPSLYNTKALYDIRTIQYTYQLDPLFVLNSSYIFDVQKCKDLEVIPTFILRAQRSLPTLTDIAVAVRYKKLYSLTAGYRTNGSFPIVAMANVYKNWKVYAGYDANIGNLAIAAKGGFEVGFGYKFTLLSGSEHKLEDLKMKNHGDSLSKVVTVLKDKITENEKKISEIRDLSQEISVLKKENEELRTENDTLSQQLRRIISTGIIPKNNGTTKIDENDVEVNIQNGYFVVVESSKNRVELEKDLMDWRRKEGSTFILRGDHGSWYYIAVEHHTTKRKAIRRMEEIRKKYPNAWVRIQKNKG